MIKKIFSVSMVLIAAILLLLVVLRTYRFSNAINTRLEESTLNSLSEISLNVKFFIEDDLTKKIEFLDSLVDTLITVATDEERIAEYIADMSRHSSFGLRRIAVVDKDGNGITEERQYVDISEADYFETLKEGNIVITDFVVSPVTGGQAVIIASPIFIGGVFDGAIQAEVAIEDIEYLFESSFDGRGYYFVVDAQGTIISQTQNEYTIATDNLFESMAYVDVEGGYDIDYLVGAVENEQEFTLEYTVEDEKRLAQIRTIENTDWYLFTAIPEEVISQESDEISADVYVFVVEMCVAVAGALIAIIVLQLTWNRNVRRALEYDKLTGVYNLSKFKIEIKKKLMKYPKERFTIIKLDLINFKSINEIHGFEVGNQVIRQFAGVGKKSTLPHFMQARVGADEFLLFAPYEVFEHLDKTSKYYEALFASGLDSLDQHDFQFRYGRYAIPDNRKEVDEIVNNVTMAHYFAKEKAGSCIVDYNDSFTKNVIRATEITNKMNMALINKEFKLYLQGKACLQTGEIIGAEALVRWQQADGSFVYPDEFIPIFESNGFIVDLDFYMLKKACDYLKTRIRSRKKPIPISVNFSRLHLNDDEMVNKIIEIVDGKKVPRELIEIELTESISLDKEDKVVEFEKKLHENGFKLSMDDFGTGYSSFETIQKINFDVIKLDKSLMAFLTENDKRKIVITSIVKMINSLGMKSVAEGVETKEQAEFLLSIGCDTAQGYYFSRPVDVSDFDKILK